ncbi:DUF1707 SHOCT-like domain-containing protein [Phytoactinopolyspora halotolerans]|uniref:DUF1707 domain-containing protein n=1 Tax=Phytoactinopolyspora halotolerans TaxID=1981512 RepID=A0A6L9SB29_9ACTN|nr:DUF1707 domain-containing protein [Phytoactinopolyspora halotolerans]NEE02565.1 DUF1707 domain-containing protein [Phytoactinopolyspora halotolerans]
MSSESYEPPLPATRASDADRDAVAELLRGAVADGQLELSELDERLAAIYAAKTRAELEAVTADLDREPAPRSAARPVLTLQTKSGSLKKDGYWTVPARIIAECSSGSIRLDFTAADCPHREISVEATAASGSVLIIVPHGWAVDVDDVSCTSGSASNRVNQRRDPDAPLVRVSGQVKSGSIIARYPRRSFSEWLRSVFGRGGDGRDRP